MILKTEIEFYTNFIRDGIIIVYILKILEYIQHYNYSKTLWIIQVQK